MQPERRSLYDDPEVMKPMLLFQANQLIQEGQEIFLSYGSAYFDQLNLPCRCNDFFLIGNRSDVSSFTLKAGTLQLFLTRS